MIGKLVEKWMEPKIGESSIPVLSGKAKVVVGELVSETCRPFSVP